MFSGAALSPEPFAAAAKAVPKDAAIVVYCKSGKRSAMAWHSLRAAGYRNVVGLEGGIDAWNAEAPR